MKNIMCSQNQNWWRMVLLAGLLWPAADVLAKVNVLTYHNDSARTGQNTNETVLTPASVASADFGKIFSLPVDGYVYAQPLVVTGVTIPGQGVHDVVYVATEHDSVYAFDANSSTTPLWQVSFINPDAGITTVNSDDVSCEDLVPEIGITSTPVIDTASGTIYVSAKTKEVANNVTNYYHRLHALDLASGAEKFGGPVVVSATVAGTGAGNDGAGQVAFNPLTQFNRAALLLSKGVVYLASASHCDNGPYHGWVIGYGAQTLTLSNKFNTTPNGEMGGIWQSGGGPACDASGNLYVITGNGTFDPSASVNCYGDSFLKLSTTNGLKLADYFTPYNQAALSSSDLDLGSGGALVLPNEAGGSTVNQRLVVGAGKEGTIYLINRDNMRHYSSANDNLIVQSLVGVIGSCFDTPAYFNKKIYCLGANDVLKAFTITNAHIATPPASQSATAFGFPGATPSISANGINSGIVWVLQTDAYASGGPTVLHAYNANNVAVELYNSSNAGTRDVPGGAVKFTVPTVANGKVYVGAQSVLAVYGIGNFLATPVITPAGGTFTDSAVVTITESSPGTTIYYTLDGSTPTTSSTPYTGPFTMTSSASIRAKAFKTGAVDSDVAAADLTVMVAPPVIAPAGGIFTDSVLVTITDSNPQASIYYTLDGSTPTTSSTLYTGSFTITSSANIQARAFKPGAVDSDVATASLTVGIAPPEITPASGTFTNSVLVTITDANPEAGIYYTRAGSPPTTSSTPYTGPFTITSSAIVQARAFKFGAVDSDIATATLTVIHPVVDKINPICRITAPTSGQRWSNDVFLVTGTAADNLAVASVFYNVNNTGWNLAETVNSWNNWTAQATLTPGTNTVSAFAVDTADNHSTTNTVKFVYIVSARLTVSINGNGGTITPNYNNARLQIGASYSMTASAKTGFAFSSWTDGNGNVITNKAKLKFVMAPDLAFTANFVDTARPTASITNLPASRNVSNEFFTIKGRAADNVAVADVSYNLNNTGWNVADTGNNWTNWSALLDLTPGTNLILISARDTAGNLSANSPVRLVYVVSAPLTVSASGGGSIAPNYNHARLQVGANYALTAVPKTGFAFTAWTDGSGLLVTNRPVLKFTMVPELSFTANFVDGSRPALTVKTPTALTSAANRFYVASGRAADNAAVAGVLYQINGVGWYEASTTNSWTNWNVTLDLTPGTNYFSAYAVDTSGNLSATSPVKFLYTTAPATLNGLKAAVTPAGDDYAFGPSTFSLFSATTNTGSGVGHYTYTKLTPSSGRLKLTYSAPPQLTNAGPQTIDLAFSAPNVAQYDNTGETGGIVFTSTPTLALPFIFNQTLVQVNTSGQGQSTRYVAGKYVSVNLATRATTSGTSYAYIPYSPLGALLKQVGSDSTTYLVLTYLGTNHGAAYVESYNGAGSLTGADVGVFSLASQRPGGNAPASLASRSALVTSVDSQFKLTFMDDFSFAQLSAADASITNGVGSYVYARYSTNGGNLDLQFTAPAQAASALFQFTAPNFAVFTNADGTTGAAVFK